MVISLEDFPNNEKDSPKISIWELILGDQIE